MARHRAETQPGHRARRAKRPSSWRQRAAIAMAALVIVGGGGVATQAGFVDTATSTVKAEVGKVEITAGGSTSTTVTFGDGVLGPGEYTEPITIKNTGTLPTKITWERTSPNIGSTNGGTQKTEATLKFRARLTTLNGNGSWSLYSEPLPLDSFVPQEVTLEPGWSVTYELVLDIKPGATRITGTTPTVVYTVTGTQA